MDTEAVPVDDASPAAAAAIIGCVPPGSSGLQNRVMPAAVSQRWRQVDSQRCGEREGARRRLQRARLHRRDAQQALAGPRSS